VVTTLPGGRAHLGPHVPPRCHGQGPDQGPGGHTQGPVHGAAPLGSGHVEGQVGREQGARALLLMVAYSTDAPGTVTGGLSRGGDRPATWPTTPSPRSSQVPWRPRRSPGAATAGAVLVDLAVALAGSPTSASGTRASRTGPCTSATSPRPRRRGGPWRRSTRSPPSRLPLRHGQQPASAPGREERPWAHTWPASASGSSRGPPASARTWPGYPGRLSRGHGGPLSAGGRGGTGGPLCGPGARQLSP